MEVQRALRDQGDQPEKEREIQHWAYFRDNAAAARFADWARESEYKEISVNPPSEDGLPLWRVKMMHSGTLQPNDISSHSLAISRQARAAGGQYDGWESPVAL